MNDWEEGDSWRVVYDGAEQPDVRVARINAPYVRNGRAYNFRVRARNLQGSSDPSIAARYMATTPRIPFAPLSPRRDPTSSINKLNSGNTVSLGFTWSQPPDNGGSPLTSYIVEMDANSDGSFSFSEPLGQLEVQTVTFANGNSVALSMPLLTSASAVVDSSMTTEQARDAIESLLVGQHDMPMVHVEISGAVWEVTFILPSGNLPLLVSSDTSVATVACVADGAGTPEVQRITVGCGAGCSGMDFKVTIETPFDGFIDATTTIGGNTANAIANAFINAAAPYNTVDVLVTERATNEFFVALTTGWVRFGANIPLVTAEVLSGGVSTVSTVRPVQDGKLIHKTHGLAPGVFYRFRSLAVNAIGQSEPSAIATILGAE
ncbi:Fndc3a, partial [Symbiodinium sp. KB8]